MEQASSIHSVPSPKAPIPPFHRKWHLDRWAENSDELKIKQCILEAARTTLFLGLFDKSSSLTVLTCKEWQRMYFLLANVQSCLGHLLAKVICMAHYVSYVVRMTVSPGPYSIMDPYIPPLSVCINRQQRNQSGITEPWEMSFSLRAWEN